MCNCVSSVASVEWFVTVLPHNASASSALVAELCNSWLLSADVGVRHVACHIVSNVVRNFRVSVNYAI